MPSAHAGRALDVSGLGVACRLLLLSCALGCAEVSAAAAWKSVPLPFAPELKVEVPAEAKPELAGKEWFANGFMGGINLPHDQGFLSAYLHEFTINPVGLAPYTKADTLGKRVKDLAVASCYTETADAAHYCPPELIKISEFDSAYGTVYVADISMKRRRGGEGSTDQAAFLLVLGKKGAKDHEGIVFRSLRGEVKNRLITRLGLPIAKDVPFTPMKDAPLAPPKR